MGWGPGEASGEKGILRKYVGPGAVRIRQLFYNIFYRSILLPIWGRIHPFFLCPGTFLRKEKKMETLGLDGEDAQKKNKDNTKGRDQQKPVSARAEGKGGPGWGRLQPG